MCGVCYNYEIPIVYMLDNVLCNCTVLLTIMMTMAIHELPYLVHENNVSIAVNE